MLLRGELLKDVLLIIARFSFRRLDVRGFLRHRHTHHRRPMKTATDSKAMAAAWRVSSLLAARCSSLMLHHGGEAGGGGWGGWGSAGSGGGGDDGGGGGGGGGGEESPPYGCGAGGEGDSPPADSHHGCGGCGGGDESCHEATGGEGAASSVGGGSGEAPPTAPEGTHDSSEHSSQQLMDKAVGAGVSDGSLILIHLSYASRLHLAQQ